MFSFRLKNTSTGIEVYIARTLFVIAAVAAYVYAVNVYVKYVSIVLLLAVAVFTRAILKKYRIDPLVLLGMGAVITLFTSGSVVFAVVLVIYGIFLKMMSKETILDVNAEMIIVKHPFYERIYKWTDMSNVVLKDDMLTLDFRSNKIFQSEVKHNEIRIDEKEFNQFCIKQIQNCLSLYPDLNSTDKE